MRRVLLSLASCVLFACGYAQPIVEVPEEDASVDAGRDGGGTGGNDGGTGTDSGTDSGTIDTDAGNTDAGRPRDAGEVDSGVPSGCTISQTRPCYSFGDGLADPTLDAGASAACQPGTQTCTAIGGGQTGWSSCQGEVVPTAETCNTVDDDCDGQVDGVCGVTMVLEGPYNGGLFGQTTGVSGAATKTVNCPDGGVLKGMRAYSGANLDELIPECGNLNLVRSTSNPDLYELKVTGSQYIVGPFGGTGGSQQPDFHCTTNAFSTRMAWYDGDDDGNGVYRTEGMKMYCSKMSALRQADGGFEWTRTASTISPIIGDNDILVTHDEACPHPLVQSGIQIRHDDHIRALGLICSRPVITLQ